MTEIIKQISEWQQLRQSAELLSATIGFVPTMGGLHEGHASLLERCKAENNISVLSIFLNPTQFDQPEDLQTYPAHFSDDVLLAKQLGVDYIFAPNANDMYPDDYTFKITSTTELATMFEGKSRPGHFDGMLTVVLKLLNLIKPTRIYLGEKDYQQLCLIDMMTKAFFINTEVVACPTVRNADGLALSSRNKRLPEDQITKAAHFAQWLRSSHDNDEISHTLAKLGFAVEYIAEYDGRRYGAVRLGNVRLIDNVIVEDTYVTVS